jgi:glutamate synthase domain-containing protein 3
VIEALAPTTERDFAMLPPEKQQLYEMLQVTHMHCSPDGPWFFLIAQSDREDDQPVYRLTGITDTSMLRPQVFAWQGSEDGPAIGFAASEKQGIDAALASLASEDSRFWSHADRYWNARGGSHTDGGAFVFSVRPDEDDSAHLSCADKFGRPVGVDTAQAPYRPNGHHPRPFPSPPEGLASEVFDWAVARLPNWGYPDVLDFLNTLEVMAAGDEGRERTLEILTLLVDRRYPTGNLRRSSLLSLYDACFSRVVEGICESPSRGYAYSSASRRHLDPALPGQKVVVDAPGFPHEGPDSLALEVVRLYEAGFRRIVVAHAQGHRFLGSGFGANTKGLVLDVYGSSGDYLASGIDGMDLRLHGSGQDQMAQIMKSGTLAVYGDVGQTFMYGAKGGEAYVLGSAAGRPLINAVGRPRVVINGTCLDYLAESFMAGDPHAGGGFVILNGITLTDGGEVVEMETPYPGGNLFSLASGGAIFIRDPHQQVGADQLNGGEFAPFEARDWALIEPYLEENARRFGLPVATLLTVDGERRSPEQVYRKIAPKALRALQAEEAWVHNHNHKH